MQLLLADDHMLFRDALIQFISVLKPEWRVITTSNFDDAYSLLEDGYSFDLVMLDMRMPGMNGLDGLEKIIKNYPDQQVSIISGVIEEHDVRKAMSMGARAYFPKTLQGRALVKAIDLVTIGERFVPLDDTGTRVMPSYFDNSEKKSSDGGSSKDKSREAISEQLTPREREVIVYLGQGLSNKEIARELDLKVATVKLHISGICKKLNANNRTQAALIAYQNGFIDPMITINESKSGA